MNKSLLTTSTHFVAVLLFLLTVGCSTEDKSEENVSAADQRWESSQSREPDESQQQGDGQYELESLVSGETAHPEITFAKDISYGSSDETAIGTMGPFVVDVYSRVYIIDSDQLVVHVFQADGSYLTSIGREGRGPGEFLAVTPRTSMTIHNNVLYISDASPSQLYFPHRVHQFLLEDFSFSGTVDLLASNKTDFIELDGYYPRNIYPRGDGAFLVSYYQFPVDYGEGESFIYYVVQDSTGDIRSEPLLIQQDVTNLILEVTDTPIPYRAIHSFPFHGKSLVSVSKNSDIYAVKHTEEFRIDVYTPDGKHIRYFDHFENMIFKMDEVLDYFDRINYMPQFGEGVSQRMVREAQNLPDIWPAIEEMLIDDENRLWISTIVDDFSIYEWWVLEESGELITRFEWPREEPIEVIRNGYIYTRETDEETGLQQVVRHRFEIAEV